jgi:predicted  nucleic acid-binding Zn-ribbon protein
MFDPEFDPLDILMKQQHKISQLDQNIKQLAVAYNSRNDLIDQLVANVQQLNQKVYDLEITTEKQEADITRLCIERRLR